MKNFLSRFARSKTLRFQMMASLIAAAFFLFATDGGHFAVFPAAMDATTFAQPEPAGGHFAPPPREP
ncbi:MAG: hypothetical protein HUU01_23170 [Saprospiraceae bacterium]|nr:hypothetical protein [Saprospiraceae bacterium]